MSTTVASHKGAVDRPPQALMPVGFSRTLIGSDPNRSATGTANGGQLPFRVIHEQQAAGFTRDTDTSPIKPKPDPATRRECGLPLFAASVRRRGASQEGPPFTGALIGAADVRGPAGNNTAGYGGLLQCVQQ